MRAAIFIGVIIVAGGAAIWYANASRSDSKNSIELLNVSYDPTRELWQDINKRFAPIYEKQFGTKLVINQSHGGSSTQARKVIEGLDADVVTLALWSDTEAIHKKHLIADRWEDRLPNHSLPYTSTIIFVVRKGNPKSIRDWSDLARADVQIITPNPKTSGNGKLSFLAAWGSVLKAGKSEAEAKAFVKDLYSRVPVLDTGARGSTTTFAQKHIGDVHLTWENEAYLEVAEAKGELQLVYPSRSIRAEPQVALVDANVDRKGTRAAAEAYLKFLYTDEAQEIIAKHHYRPSSEAILRKHEQELQPIELFGVDVVAKDWDDAQSKFFAEGAIFDSLYDSKPAEANAK